MTKPCKYCGHKKLPKKSGCRNIQCHFSIPYKKKKNDEEKERKRIEREKKKKLRPPRTGTNVKGRDGSTRHGMVISFSKHHGPEITEEDVDNRNNLLGIDPTKCFWCKTADKQCIDHAHPCCNTTDSEYSHTNVLNCVPSCNSCNSKKGGKRLEDWIKENLSNLGWSLIEINTYQNWLYENKNKLLFNQEDAAWLERQFIEINNFHSVCERCTKSKEEIKDFIPIKKTYNEQDNP